MTRHSRILWHSKDERSEAAVATFPPAVLLDEPYERIPVFNHSASFHLVLVAF